eukprot:4538812-Amphidinium_carterae.1
MQDQNRILKLLMQTAKLGALPERKEGADNNQAPGTLRSRLQLTDSSNRQTSPLAAFAHMHAYA